ncbi:15727_t:CDS:2 [Entrophospora sp. SA101]|nr:15727_t:CDS:2 [Entrophospora sp. SA101]
MELKSKFSKNPSPLFNRLLVDLQGISAYELSWKDPIASQVVSDNSDMIRQLPEDLFNNFMVGDLPSLTRELAQKMVPPSLSVVQEACRRFISSFDEFPAVIIY